MSTTARASSAGRGLIPGPALPMYMGILPVFSATGRASSRDCERAAGRHRQQEARRHQPQGTAP
jgi:hypothetical protein